MIGFANAQLTGTPLSPKMLGPAGTTLAAAYTSVPGSNTITVGHTVGFTTGTNNIIINPGGGVAGYPGTEERGSITGVNVTLNQITYTRVSPATGNITHSKYTIVKMPAPSTTSTAGGTAGTNTITLASIAGMETGQYLQIELNTAREEIGRITGINTTTNEVTLSLSSATGNFRYTHPVGISDSVRVIEGVPPAGDSALLRANNRGVCERCHNK
jgi:hypothetical protein